MNRPMSFCTFALVMLSLCSTPTSTYAAGAMTFENHCVRNHVEYCYAVADGEITADTPAAFDAYLQNEHSDGFKVLLNSTGGSLRAGMELARIIRDLRFATEVGIWRPEGALGEITSGGRCESACAYAFVGGVSRAVPKGNELGFHRFFIGSDPTQAATAVDAAATMDFAQQVSGLLISHLVEMNVDARIFVKAADTASDRMYIPSEVEMLEYDLITPMGFGRFSLQPSGEGVLAISNRLDTTQLYDDVGRVMAYCRQGNPFIALNALEHGLSEIDSSSLSLRFEIGDSVIEDQIASNNVNLIFSDSQGVYIEADVRGEPSELLLKADLMSANFFASRVSGGDYRATLQLNAQDRQMVAAAFKFCL